jgi:hypothetical protein
MDNWLNTKAGRDFSMRTIPDATKALNRLADALLEQDNYDLQDQAVKNKSEAERDWQADAFILYKALSRFNKAHEHEEIVVAQTMAFDILSKVSWDFRNEYVCHEWQEKQGWDLGYEHGKKKWISMIQWHCEVCNGPGVMEDGQVGSPTEGDVIVPKGDKYPCGSVPNTIDYIDLLSIGIMGTDQHTDKPNEPMIGYEDGHYEKILNLQIGDTHVTEEPFNGYVIWRRVE